MPHPPRTESSTARTLATLILMIAMISGCSDPQPPAPGSLEPVVIPSAEATLAQQTQPQAAQQEAMPIACDEVNGIRPACGFKNPEDLAVVPGGELLLVSEMGTFLADTPNTLSLFNIATNQRQTIAVNWDADGTPWGDPNCTAPDPDKFSPHGIDLMTRADGRHQLLVVNHGDEQVEFFELMNPGGTWQLHWKGCAKPPGDPFINDVAGLNDGGFFATQMWNKTMPFDEVVERLNAGEKIGWVWQWQAHSGFTKLPNSDELMPNGIAVNKDNSKIFVNIYMGNKTIRIDRASTEVDAQFTVKNPDNIIVDGDGSLWVASHLNDPIEGRCPDNHAGPCLLPFEVIKADPDTMEPQVVFEHSGEPMGYVTVALPHQGRLYMGTASGDRLASTEIR
jgi:sugar lactone lactonase YvrE